MYESKTAGGIDGRGTRTLRRFLNETDGFAITLTIISLPFFLAIAAWVIDASRVGNLHTDLQNAVDAMALAGARELDGRDDAIPRAQNAIAGLAGSNRNVAFFAGGGVGMSMGGVPIGVVYDPANALASEVEVHFLKLLPDSDDEPIVLADHEVDAGTIAEQSNQARYAYVIAKNQSLQTIFPLAMAGRQTVQVNAEAVATYTVAACDVTPIFICNPFETPTAQYPNPSFRDNFKLGNLYGRQITMNIESGSSAGPGNFGFLRLEYPGGNELGDALAQGTSGVCYQQKYLDTEPGGTIGQVFPGINTRMGLYRGRFNNNDPLTPPDKNVRKGQKQPVSGADCSDHAPEENPLFAMGFPESSNGTETIGGGTGYISIDGDWDLDLYWDIAHGGTSMADVLPFDPPDPDNPYIPDTPVPDIDAANWPGPAASPPAVPSRYDVYLYENANPPAVDDLAPNNETGASTGAGACYTGPPPIEDTERRVIFSAVVNCLDQQDQLYGTSGDPEAIAFARMFITRPGDRANKNLFLEVIDITGSGGLGTVEELLREESELVR